MKIYTNSAFGVLDTDNERDHDTIEFVTGMTVAELLARVNTFPPMTPELLAALSRGDGAGQATDGGES